MVLSTSTANAQRLSVAEGNLVNGETTKTSINREKKKIQHFRASVKSSDLLHYAQSDHKDSAEVHNQQIISLQSILTDLTNKHDDGSSYYRQLYQLVSGSNMEAALQRIKEGLTQLDNIRQGYQDLVNAHKEMSTCSKEFEDLVSQGTPPSNYTFSPASTIEKYNPSNIATKLRKPDDDAPEDSALEAAIASGGTVEKSSSILD